MPQKCIAPWVSSSSSDNHWGNTGMSSGTEEGTVWQAAVTRSKVGPHCCHLSQGGRWHEGLGGVINGGCRCSQILKRLPIPNAVHIPSKHICHGPGGWQHKTWIKVSCDSFKHLSHPILIVFLSWGGYIYLQCFLLRIKIRESKIL